MTASSQNTAGVVRDPVDAGAEVFPVRRVTLLEDRAQVTRAGRVEGPPGARQLRLGVSPLVVDRSLVARGEGLRVHEVRVERRWRVGPGARTEVAEALVTELREAAQALDDALATGRLLADEQAAAKRAVELVVAATNRELPHAEGYEPRWASDLRLALDDLGALRRESFAHDTHLRSLRDALEAAITRARAAGRVDQVLTAELVVDLTLHEAPAGAALTLDYTVPCALWRPMHRATLTRAPTPAVAFECEAALWQATGEDWVEVELAFSTARPTQRAEPARLEDDRLRVRKKVDRKAVVEVREQRVATLGEGAVAPSEALQGVDDGGEARLFVSPVKATIRADGRMRRVPLHQFSAPAELDRIARPERSPLVHLRSSQANVGAYPLLAGPVELIGESGYLGLAELGYIAPGERFTLGWGGDEGLRVARRQTESRDTSRLTGKQTVTRKIELFVSNLEEREAVFRLEERIPVSELSEVEVRLDLRETKPTPLPEARPDEHGMVAWQVKLAPLGTAELTLVHELVAGSEVTL